MITVSVDDKIASARLISDMMKKLDPDGTHEEEKDPEKALERIVRLHPDIVWLDIEMSGMNGLELAAEIKKKSPFTNIVFVTGHPEYAIDGFSLHVSGFVLSRSQRQSCSMRSSIFAVRSLSITTRLSEYSASGALRYLTARTGLCIFREQ